MPGQDGGRERIGESSVLPQARLSLGRHPGHSFPTKQSAIHPALLISGLPACGIPKPETVPAPGAANEFSGNPGLLYELLSRVVFRGSGSGGVLQDSVSEDSSFENKNDLVMPVESSPASAG
jgi:hypothetical protein